MKSLNKLKLLMLLFVMPCAGYANECRQANCIVESCTKEFRSLVGVWHGREKMDLNDDLLSTEVQMIFADKACKSNKGLIVGRQTTVIPSGKNNASRVDYREVVVSIAGSSDRSARDDSKLIYDLTDLQIKEDAKKTTLKLPEREVEFQKLVAGQVTHFAGKAWALTSEGRLIGVNNFLMESSYDPSSNEVVQKIHYQGSQGGDQLEVSVYDVVTDVYSGSRMDRRMASKNKSLDTNRDAAETVANGKLYAEERITIGNSSKGVLLFKSGEQITATEFQKRIEKRLLDQNVKLRKPASKVQP